MTGANPGAIEPAVQKRWARIALGLVAGTLTYNIIEAVVALWAGLEADSVVLLGFGLDSVIEMVAAALMLWRLTVEVRGTTTSQIARTERRVRLFVGVTFLMLAAYVVAQAGVTLRMRRAPDASLVGIVLAGLSLMIMPLLSWAKLRAARQIGSASLRAEAKETLACSYLSFALLLGLGANAAIGWWWADPTAALLMVPWLVKEGLEGVRDDDDD